LGAISFISDRYAGLFGVSLRWATNDHTFLFKPYIQLGDNPNQTVPERLEIVWQTSDIDSEWWVESQTTPGGAWVRAATPSHRRVAFPTVDPHRVYRAALTDLRPGERFRYRVGIGDKILFESEARARIPAGKPFRTAIIGDVADGTRAATQVAHGIFEQHPDLVVIAGDIVYARGRVSEYATRFFPVYNGEDGLAILRSTLAVAAAGNHDIGNSHFDKTPDGLEYYMAWSQPLNGPLGTINAPNTPKLEGSESRVKAFLEAAGSNFPRMTNFSFDYGDVHWTILDANVHVDWTNPELRDWLEKDLTSARPGAWKLVTLHQPGFNSSVAHGDEQQARLIADIFERHGVSIVFGGHVHNYQRTKPLTFQLKPKKNGLMQTGTGRVDGSWKIDNHFDGKQNTTPQGVIYIITGAGGATLHDYERQDLPQTWFDFTQTLISKIHSFTLMDVESDRLKLQQIDVNGKVVDRLTITRSLPSSTPTDKR
jgi:predicted phosphodiesterase